MVDYAIHLSSTPSTKASDVNPKRVFDTLGEITTYLGRVVSTDPDNEFSLAVRRADVLGSALLGIDRKAFSPFKPLKVSFFGEEAQDGGGPRREFFRLLADGIKSSMCVGSNECYILRHDVVGLQAKKFERLGQLMALSLAQEGSGFSFFAPCMFDYICGKDVHEITVDVNSVPDYEAHDLLLKLKDMCDESMLHQTLLDASDVVVSSGYTKPLVSAKLSDIAEISKTIALHYSLLQSLAEIDQLKKGLESLGVLELMKNNSDLLAPFFTSIGSKKLTADKVQNFLNKVVFSDDGTTSRSLEETTYTFFIHLLNDCEDADHPHLTLEDIVIFFTGSDKIPLGSNPPPSIMFHDGNIYPKASTCAMTLILPTKYKTYSEFKEKVTFAMKYHGGFGLI